MDMKVNNIQQITQPTQANQVQTGDQAFKFALASNIAEHELQTKITLMMEEITMQGKKVGKRMDIREMKKYRMLIKDFMNEIVTHSHEFSRENYLDRRGRHRVYGPLDLFCRLWYNFL